MQIETTMRYYLTNIRMTTVKKKKNRKQQILVQQQWSNTAAEKLNTQLPYDPAIPLLDTCQKN